MAINQDDIDAIEASLREAKKHLSIAIGKMGNSGVGGLWPGSWGEYRKMVKIGLAIETLVDHIHRRSRAWSQHRNFARNFVKGKLND